MKINLAAKGFAELERALAEELPKVTAQRTLTASATKAMKRIENRMTELAPEDEGDLKRSMKTAKVKAKRQRGGRYARSTGVEIQTGPAPTGKINRANAGWQEEGTVNMRANPYARPAIDAEGPHVIAEVREVLKDKIEKAKARIARKAARAKG